MPITAALDVLPQRRAAFLAIAAALTVALLAPGAAAHPRQALATDATFVSCTGTIGDRPAVVSVFVLDGAVLADVGLYAPGADPTTALPELVAILDATYEAGRLDGRGRLAPADDGGGQGRVAPGDEVLITAQLTEVGTDPVHHRHRDGNTLVRWKGSEVRAAGAGTIQVADSTGALDCEALQQRWDGMRTAPDSTVLRTQVGTIACEVVDGQGNELTLYGDGYGLDAWVTAPDGTITLDAFSHDDFNAAFSSKRLDHVILVHDGETGERLDDGRVAADVTLSGSAVRTRERFPGGSAQVSERPLTFRGEAELGGLRFDLSSCSGSWFDVKVQLRDPAEGKGRVG